MCRQEKAQNEKNRSDNLKKKIGKLKAIDVGHWNKHTWKLNNPQIQSEIALILTGGIDGKGERPYDILFLSESNLNKIDNEDSYKIPGYRLIKNKGFAEGRDNRSRACAYVREGLKVKIRRDLQSGNHQDVWLEVSICGGNIIAGSYYREFQQERGPTNKSDRKSQQKRLTEYLEFINMKLENQKKDLVVMGDWNVDFTKEGKDNY